MFGRQPKDKKAEETPDIPEIMFTPDSELENISQENTEINQVQVKKLPHSSSDNPEIVNIVEKISGIVSPYFIAIVGLILYEDNFWLGLLLIAVGILSLLKISWTDITGFFGEVKDVFSSDD